MSDKRLIKTPLETSLIRRMDEAIVGGQGGFTTRHEFIAEAIENLLLELTFSDETAQAELSNNPDNQAIAMADYQPATREAPESPRIEIADSAIELFDARLPKPPAAAVIESGIASMDRSQFMFGLHNRDFPSLWAASRLAAKTTNGPVPWDAFVASTTAEAWELSKVLGRLESTGFKLNALLPGNDLKRQSSERGFQNFAIGSIAKSTSNEDTVIVDGPLFAWQVCQLMRANEEVVVALTPAGHELLTEVSGLDARVPHPPALFLTFMEHLDVHSPGDARGFRHLLGSVSDSPSRDQLVDSFRAALDPDSTDSYANTVAQGYVARGREWGLISLGLVGGRYILTEFGQSVLQSQQ